MRERIQAWAANGTVRGAARQLLPVSCTTLLALLLYELAAISRKLDLILHLLMRAAPGR